MLDPWAFDIFVRASSEEKLDPVFETVSGKGKDHLVKLLGRYALLLRSRPKGRFQLVAVCMVVINVGPDHERYIAPHSEALFEMNRRSGNELLPPAARVGPDDVVSLPRPKPCRVQLSNQDSDEQRINTATALSLVQADNAGTVSHGSTPL
jgi:hypothetical protein